jgi:hypothetical protein
MALVKAPSIAPREKLLPKAWAEEYTYDPAAFV